MTDYLELLLEQQEGEEEEDAEAPALGTEGEDSPRRGGRQEGPPPDTAAADAGRQGAVETARRATSAPESETEELPDLPGPAPKQKELLPSAAFALGQETLPHPAGAVSRQGEVLPYPTGAAPEQLGEMQAPARRKTAGEMLEQALGRAADALERGVRGGAGRTAALARETGGAAGLARRLSEAALSEAAPARTVFAAEMINASPAGDWEEFDRRLERDARRYDGGMGIY